jgi:hypothetical protein
MIQTLLVFVLCAGLVALARRRNAEFAVDSQSNFTPDFNPTLERF